MKMNSEREISRLPEQERYSQLVLAHGALGEKLDKLYLIDMENDESCEEYLGSCTFSIAIFLESFDLRSAFTWLSGGYRLRGYFVIDYYGYSRMGVTYIDLKHVEKLDAISAAK